MDKGGEFTATQFRERLDAWRVGLRYDSVPDHRANARFERFWRSLKQILRSRPLAPERPLTMADSSGTSNSRFSTTLTSDPTRDSEAPRPPRSTSACSRPTSTPASRREGAAAIPPVPEPARVDFLDGDPRFPFLRRAA